MATECEKKEERQTIVVSITEKLPFEKDKEVIKISDVGQKQTYKTRSQISPADPEKTLHQLHEQYGRMNN